jgi:homoserine kinase type II
MAVYTEVPDDDLDAFLSAYDLGAVRSFKGIAEGVENSNYLLHTEQGSFILTLYEKRVAEQDLPFFLGLMDHLAARGIACPTPVKARDGMALRRLRGRPAALVTFLDGVSVKRPRVEHCAALGPALAGLHDSARDFTARRANALGIPGFRPLAEACGGEADRVSPGLASEIQSELLALEAAWPKTLPQGIIHADLFPDNVFFMKNAVSGLIDFYFACNDFLAYDLAICLNAWCFEEDGQFNITKARAFLKSYGQKRALRDEELKALPVLARGAALRFLLTRLYDWLKPAEGALVQPKDPLEYLAKLRFHRHVTGPAAYGL